ncbi:hypothetical protein WG66_013460, partial [Moniliophthora roreri]
ESESELVRYHVSRLSFVADNREFQVKKVFPECSLLYPSIPKFKVPLLAYPTTTRLVTRMR